MGGFAWVTLATNDSYSLGALVLAHSLRQVGTVHQLAVLVTPGVTSVMREKLASVFNVVKEVNILDSQDEANLRLLKRPELGITFTKLHCWRLTQFEKCVFLDADTMVLANADELFEREEFSAAPDVGWPDCFNSGVYVYRPSEETYSKLVQFALDKGSFDGGDQGLLNLYFSDWAHKDISKHLPFIYNMCSTASYSYLPAFKQFGGNVKIIHFIGNSKPWMQYFDSETQHVEVVSEIQHLRGVVQQWWNIFCSHIHPLLSPQMAGLAGAFARLTLGVPRSAEQALLEDQLRKQGWEVGNIDYMGRDSFDNIWSKICETLTIASATPQIVTFTAGETVAEPRPPAVPVEEVTKPVITESKQELSEEVVKEKTTVQTETCIAIIPEPTEISEPQVECKIKPTITQELSEGVQMSEEACPVSTSTNIPESPKPDKIPVQESPITLTGPPTAFEPSKPPSKPIELEKVAMQQEESPITLTGHPTAVEPSKPPSKPIELEKVAMQPESPKTEAHPPSSETQVPPTQVPKPELCAKPQPSEPSVLAQSEVPTVESPKSALTPAIEAPKTIEKSCTIAELAKDAEPPKSSSPQSEVATPETPKPALIPLGETPKLIEKQSSPEEVPKVSCEKPSTQPETPKLVRPASETSKPESIDCSKSLPVSKPTQIEKPPLESPIHGSQPSKPAPIITAPVTVSEPAKPQPQEKHSTIKTAPVPISESSKPQSQVKPSTPSETSKSKSKAEGKAARKGTPPKTGQEAVQEANKPIPPKSTVEVPQKPKEVVQTSKQESSTGDGPTPPPRKGGSGGGAASKKGGKGKK